MGCLLIVDDDRDHLTALCDLMNASGHTVTGFENASDVLAFLQTSRADLILTDLRMPGMTGLELMHAVKQRDIDLPVVLLTGHGDVGHAVEAMKAGAEDFLEKPYDAEHLVQVVERTLAARAARLEVLRLQSVIGAQADATLLGRSRAILELRQRISAIASLDVDVVIIGETGTGKELAARALHASSNRAEGPFIAINCAALPEAMAEVILFGQAANAFSGVGGARHGKLEAASGGTLLLDEVEAMSASVQAKLLRVLEERQVERLGETCLRPLDIRVIATSKRDLRLVDGFRADLYYRLAGVELRTPCLKEMGEDIPLLFSHYAELAARRYGRVAQAVDWRLEQYLKRRAWPGNVRELKAVAEAHALGISTPSPVGMFVQSSGALAERVAQFEAREIAAVLDRHRGNTQRAAETLEIPRRTLNDKMRRYGLLSSKSARSNDTY
ncbi:sigma-54-dependent Fis family transcriptional regulator (plasmid) [Peteryoungia desertarenae]|uniref:Sigma-54-dependent Fis family transcriptional regulator n=1 Tax=Peteryoungia desertarenae TaxID=1813451 RepID=A0ABX6QTS8_9HYPH|nr:sigma-54 dependent transcriptional regulator [Peteryoungia desertarenae]QLF71973.1 sigma-54-dependent Fis family transcriptional regulator [Peteryoungia desertarenae]